MKLRIVGLLFITASAMLITACGQKGPLYLPKDETMQTPAGTKSTSTEDASAKDVEDGNKQDAVDASESDTGDSAPSGQ